MGESPSARHFDLDAASLKDFPAEGKFVALAEETCRLAMGDRLRVRRRESSSPTCRPRSRMLHHRSTVVKVMDVFVE